MYFLEDNHPKYEYCVYIKVRGGTPYLSWQGTTLTDVYRHIKEIEKKHNRYNQHYYIDNDFYINTYHNNDYVYYYRFMKRKVNDWQTLKTKSNASNKRAA